MTFTTWLRFLNKSCRPLRRGKRTGKTFTSQPRMLSLEFLEDRTLLSTFTVVNTLDSGGGSLRAAILAANSSSGLDTIQFDVAVTDPGHLYYRDDGTPGQVSLLNVMATAAPTDADLPTSGSLAVDPDWAHSWYSIRLTSPLPKIHPNVDEFPDPVTGVVQHVSAPVIIDGYSQAGASANTLADGNDAVLRIELDGSLIEPGPGSIGLSVNGGSSTVKGLVINRFLGDFRGGGDAIRLDHLGGNRIEGNFIGSDVSGTRYHTTLVRINPFSSLPEFQRGNAQGVGVFSSDNVIGGADPASRNVISGNEKNGVSIFAGSNVVKGNFVGTTAAGTGPLGNFAEGILVQINRVDGSPPESNIIIGGTEAGARNVISANGTPGTSSSGLVLADIRGALVQGNILGLDVTGNVALGNVLAGIFVSGGIGNVIGGTDSGAGNLISANGTGVFLQGAVQTRVEGNLIGTDITGLLARGNTDGIHIRAGAHNNLIGGTTAAARNLISGNAGGIVIAQISTLDNIVQGNFIGTDITGLQRLGNGTGIFVHSSDGNLIGGTAAGAGNVISGNNASAVIIAGGHGPDPTGNRVEGNLIGLDATGDLNHDLGNAGHGVLVTVFAFNNAVGGAAPGAGNVIAYNTADGVRVGRDELRGRFNSNGLGHSAGAGNLVLGNSIFANTGLGIDVGDDNAVTANDLGDSDAGANDLQNFPVLADAEISGGNTTVSGSLNSTSNTTFRIEFFSSPVSDPSSFGEGQTFLGFTDVTTDGSGNVTFSVPLPVAVPAGHVVTATATGPRNSTSEFSGRRTALPTIRADLSLAMTISSETPTPGTNLTYTITITNNGPLDASGVVVTDTLPAAVNFVSGPAGCTEVSGVVTCTICNLASGASIVFAIIVAPQVHDAISNTASVNGNEFDPNTTNNTVTVVAGCVEPPPGLVNWWPGEGNAEDIQSGHNGAPQNGVTFDAGKVGQAFRLDGGNDYVQMPDNPAWAFGSNSFTLDLWVNFDAVRGGGVGSLPNVFLGQDEGGGNTRKWVFFYGDGGLTFHINGPAGSGFIGPVAFTPIVSQWHHLALTRSGSTYSFYADGTLLGTRTSALAIPDVNAPLTIGQAEGLGFVDGRLDEIDIFDRALSTAEILSIYQAGSVGKCTNTPPTANADSYSLAEGGMLTALDGDGTATPSDPADDGVLANDTDSEPLTAIVVTGPAHAFSFTLNPDGTFTYMHDGSETTSDSFTYRASDGTDQSNLATVSITITPVNDAPVADDDGPFVVAEAGTLTVPVPGVLDGDTDADNTTLSAILVSGPANASSFTLNADGSFTYVHNGSETTSDSFTYRAYDGTDYSNLATVSITVTPVNDAPVADNDGPFIVAEGGTLNVAAPGVLDGDIDADSPTLTAVLFSGAANASSFTLNSDGSFTYVHNGSETTSDSFSYRAFDGTDYSNVATVTITITPVNDAPVANPDTKTTNQNTPLTFPASDLIVNDQDAEVDSLTVTAVTASGDTHGTVTLAGGNVTYTPAATFSGSASFDYTISDGHGGSATSTVTVAVNPMTQGTPGKITGGGSVDSGVRNFGFVVQPNAQGPGFKGNLEFQDKSANNINLHSTSITLISVFANKGMFQGTATRNGVSGFRFRVDVEDNGEPGAGVDKFRIQISGPGGFGYDSNNFATKGGLLDKGGNIQIHKSSAARSASVRSATDSLVTSFTAEFSTASSPITANVGSRSALPGLLAAAGQSPTTGGLAPTSPVSLSESRERPTGLTRNASLDGATLPFGRRPSPLESGLAVSTDTLFSRWDDLVGLLPY